MDSVLLQVVTWKQPIIGKKKVTCGPFSSRFFQVPFYFCHENSNMGPVNSRYSCGMLWVVLRFLLSPTFEATFISELEMENSVVSGFQWFQGFRHNNRNVDFVRESWTWL